TIFMITNNDTIYTPNTVKLFENSFETYVVYEEPGQGNKLAYANGGSFIDAFYLPYNGVQDFSYTRWYTFRTVLTRTETNYKGLVTSTDYFYNPMNQLEREETEGTQTNEKYIKTYEYANVTYNN